MRLSHSIPGCIVMLIAAACGGDNKSYQTVDRVALAPFAVPMYEGITDIMQDEPFRMLPAGKSVYVTDKTATGNDIKYVQVVWGDSSAYVQEDFILQKGTLGILIGDKPENHTINIFADKELNTVRMVIQDPTALAAVVKTEEPATEILYWYGGKPVRGYIATAQALPETSDINLFREYSEEPDRDNRQMLLSTANYRDTKLATWLMALSVDDMRNDAGMDERGDAETGEGLDGDDVYGDGGAPYGDTDDVYSDGSTRDFFMANIAWIRDSKELTGDEAPGELKMFFVFENDTDMPIANAYMAGGYAYSPDGTQLSEKSVKQIRIEFTPTKALTAQIQVDTWCISCEQYNTTFTEDLACSPAKTATTFIEDPEHKMVFCSNIRVIVRANGAERRTALSAECGD